VAISDITSLKHGEEARRRMEALTQANRDLTREIGRREAVEQALRKSDVQTRQLLQQSRRMQDQLRQVSRAVLSVQEEERKRIARELHDIVAQTLTGINVRLANLKHAAETKTKGLDRHIARTQRLVEASVAVVHRFARELRPTVLDDLGLIPALHGFLKSFREQTGIQVSLSVFAGVEQMKKDKQTTFFRVAQEALANVARHAHASRAEVKIGKLEGAVCMRIRDNGTGFQLQRRLRAKKRKQLGILGMRERLEMVGGEFTIISAPGKGTTILAKIPQRDQTAKKRPRKNRAI
jgi:signal transduction histidine kinase